jgi:hypothetical protein
VTPIDIIGADDIDHTPEGPVYAVARLARRSA